MAPRFKLPVARTRAEKSRMSWLAARRSGPGAIIHTQTGVSFGLKYSSVFGDWSRSLVAIGVDNAKLRQLVSQPFDAGIGHQSVY